MSKVPLLLSELNTSLEKGMKRWVTVLTKSRTLIHCLSLFLLSYRCFLQKCLFI